jgi:hypothetical protein
MQAADTVLSETCIWFYRQNGDLFQAPGVGARFLAAGQAPTGVTVRSFRGNGNRINYRWPLPVMAGGGYDQCSLFPGEMIARHLRVAPWMCAGSNPGMEKQKNGN